MFIYLITGEHKQEAFKKVNPFQLVPVIDEGGFVLTERHVQTYRTQGGLLKLDIL